MQTLVENVLQTINVVGVLIYVQGFYKKYNFFVSKKLLIKMTAAGHK